jgi:hypothetical protein
MSTYYDSDGHPYVVDDGKPNGGPPPKPPRKSHTLRTVLLSVLVGVVAVLGVFAGCSTFFAATGGPDETGHTQVSSTDDGGTRAHPQKPAAKKPAAKPTHDPTKFGWWYDAKKDVAVSGIATDSEIDTRYVVFNVTNQSDKTLDYDVNFAYYNANGVRVGEDTAYVTSVAPGEKVAGGSDDTYVDPPSVTSVKVLSVDAEQS